jgi:hypothetical protein
MPVSSSHEIMHESGCIYAREREKCAEIQQFSTELVADRESPNKSNYAAEYHVVIRDVFLAVHMTEEAGRQRIVAAHSVQQPRGT